MRGLKRHSVNFFAKTLIGKFRVKEPVPDKFFPLSVCGLISIKSSWDDSVADSRFLWISLISFFRDLMAL